MEVKRGYGEACPVAHSLDLIGDRWALLVLRELRLGARRFTDLQAALPNAGPTVLSQRLRELEATGVLRRRTLPPPASAKVYELTEWGAGLEPVFRALAHWGMRSPVPRQGDITNDTALLGIRTFWTVDPAFADWTATYQIALGQDTYHLAVVKGALTVLARGESATKPDAVLTTDRHTLGRLMNREVTPAAAQKQGTLTISGDTPLARQLLAAITAPKPVAPRPAP